MWEVGGWSTTRVNIITWQVPHTNTDNLQWSSQRVFISSSWSQLYLPISDPQNSLWSLQICHSLPDWRCSVSADQVMMMFPFISSLSYISNCTQAAQGWLRPAEDVGLTGSTISHSCQRISPGSGSPSWPTISANICLTLCSQDYQHPSSWLPRLGEGLEIIQFFSFLPSQWSQDV